MQEEAFRIPTGSIHPNDTVSWQIQFHSPVSMNPANIRIDEA